MALSHWRPLLLIIFLLARVIFEEWSSISSCRNVPADDYSGDKVEATSHDDVKVMIVADLHLQGSEAGFFDLYFRDYFMSKFFRKSFQTLNPDMLIVLGDVSASGSELTENKWISVLHRFHNILGPFIGLPYHVVLGDRDIGECSELNANVVNWLTSNFAGIDSSGCGAFEISNISFLSVNSVALLCGNSTLQFSVEKMIEIESTNLQTKTEGVAGVINGLQNNREISRKFGLRENAVLPGSGPVLLLHFPLHRTGEGTCHKDPIIARQSVSSGLYDLLQTVPLNATKYIFQALRPSFIFSAHTHQFCDHIHTDGTREVTVPSMTWNKKGDPGFVVATFSKDTKAVSVSYCKLTKESHVLAAYTTMFVLLVAIIFCFPRL